MRCRSLAKQAPRWASSARIARASGERPAARSVSSTDCCGEGVGQPVGGLANVEGDGRGVGGDDAAGCDAIALRPGRVRGDAAPADGAGEAELVEPCGE